MMLGYCEPERVTGTEGSTPGAVLVTGCSQPPTCQKIERTPSWCAANAARRVLSSQMSGTMTKRSRSRSFSGSCPCRGAT